MRRSIAVGALLGAVMNCSHGDQSPGSATQSGKAVGSVAHPSGSATNAQVPLATRPSSDCDWIPAADVEAIVGKFAEPPREDEGGCVYTLPVPQHVLDERAKLAKLSAAIDKMAGAEPAQHKKDAPTETYGFVLEVDLKDFGVGERVATSTSAMLASWAKDENDTARAAASQAITSDSSRKALNGWDHRGLHGGRIGHIAIWIRKLALDLDLPGDKLDTLAARVRDRIPDRPFAMVGYSPEEMDHDPCALVTRQEAESVLGPLSIPPYRTGDDTPFAFATGPSCGYYTAGHHVLIVTPRWEHGKFDVAANNAIGGLVRSVSGDQEGQSADTLEGPWDQAAMSLDGRLVLLKGDRSVQIGYHGSSTDESGALKLARIAVPRLAAP